jgi:hypothetical protein
MNKNILSEDEIKTIQKMRTPWTLSSILDLEYDDEEIGDNIRKIIDMKIRCEKLVEMSSEPKNYTIKELEEMSLDELEENVLRKICNHKDPSGKTYIENNCCKFCNMKVFDISGEEIKYGLNNNMFSEYIKYRIIRAVLGIYAAEQYKEKGEDIDVKYLCNSILDKHDYYINLS